MKNLRYIFLSVLVIFNFSFSMGVGTANKIMCGVLGAGTMNGSNFDQEKCEKSDETDTSGLYGAVQVIRNTVTDQVKQMEEIKKNNIEKVKKANQEVMGAVNFGSIDNSNLAANSMLDGVETILKDSVKFFDCNYDCTQHDPSQNAGMSQQDVLKMVREGNSSMNAIKNSSLYGMCMALQKGCLSSTLDIKAMSEKLKKSTGVDSLINNLKEKQNEFKSQVNDIIAKNNEDIKGFENLINSKSQDMFKTAETWDPFGAIKEKTGAQCMANTEDVKLAAKLPPIDLCNLENIDMSEIGDEVNAMRKQLQKQFEQAMKQYVEQLKQYIITTMMNRMLEAVAQTGVISQIMDYVKMGQCGVQAMMLAATDMEAFEQGKAKFAQCRGETPPTVPLAIDGTAGCKSGNIVTVAGIIGPLPCFDFTMGAGLTSDIKAMGAAVGDFVGCLSKSFGQAYATAYQKCMRGEDFETSLDFFKEFKMDIFPELDKYKKMQCVMDKEELASFSGQLLAGKLEQFGEMFTNTGAYLSKIIDKGKQIELWKIEDADSIREKSKSIDGGARHEVLAAYYNKLVEKKLEEILTSLETSPIRFKNLEIYVDSLMAELEKELSKTENEVKTSMVEAFPGLNVQITQYPSGGVVLNWEIDGIKKPELAITDFENQLVKNRLKYTFRNRFININIETNLVEMYNKYEGYELLLSNRKDLDMLNAVNSRISKVSANIENKIAETNKIKEKISLSGKSSENFIIEKLREVQKVISTCEKAVQGRFTKRECQILKSKEKEMLGVLR